MFIRTTQITRQLGHLHGETSISRSISEQICGTFFNRNFVPEQTTETSFNLSFVPKKMSETFLTIVTFRIPVPQYD